MFKLVNLAVHDWAAQTLGMLGRASDAQVLRELPPIVDEDTARKARKVLQGLGGELISAAHACFALGDSKAEPEREPSPEFVGQYANGVVVDLLSLLPEADTIARGEKRAAIARQGHDLLLRDFERPDPEAHAPR